MPHKHTNFLLLNSNFGFAWSVDAHGLSSLAMTNLEAPNLLLYLPANQTFMLHPLYFNSNAISTLNKEQIEVFLTEAVSGKITVGFVA